MTILNRAAIVVAFAACSGCAAWKSNLHRADDVAAKKEVRKDEALRKFSENRQAAQLEAAISRWNQGDVAGFQNALEELLAQNPDHPQASLMLAELYFLHDSPQQAKVVLERFVAREPAHAQAQHLYGLVLERMGETQTAHSCFQRAAELDPKNFAKDVEPQIQLVHHETISAPRPSQSVLPAVAARVESTQAAALLQQADAAFARSSVAEADTLFSRAISAAPRDEQVVLSAAVLSLQHNQPSLAVQLLTPASQAFPGSAAVFRTLGTAHYRAGEFEAANSALARALSLDSGSALSYFLMGCTLDRLGKPEASQEHYRQAQSLDPAYASL